MPTLSELKNVCATYHDVAAADLTVNTVDLFLVAANNVRRNAELLNNFEYSRVQATLNIDGVVGGALSDAVVVGDAGSGTVSVTGTLSPDATGNYTLARGVAGNVNAVYMLQNLTHAQTQIFYLTGVWYIVDYATGDTWTGPTTISGNPSGTYTPNGPNTGTATVTFTALPAFNGIKEVLAVQRTNSDGTLSPLNFTQAETPIERDRWKIELSDNYDLSYRYPSDARFLSRGTEGTIIQRRGSLFIYPVPATSVQQLETTLECYAWLSDYVTANLSDTSPTDFFVAHGYNFLQWGIICELNYKFKTFVQRQEGNLVSPTTERDAAWRDFLLWDTYQVAANATRPR